MHASAYPEMPRILARAEGDGTKRTWLDLRRTGVTGSDVAKILGYKPSPAEVYLNKLMDADEQLEREANLPEKRARSFRFGSFLEPFLRDELLTVEADVEAVELWPAWHVYRHPDVEWMIVTPDALATLADGRTALVEFKTWHPFQADAWSRPDEPLRIPAHYWCQVQWYMRVLDLDVAIVVVLIGNDDLRTYWIPRADGWLDRKAVPRAEAFWTQSVCGGVMPDVDGTEAASDLIAYLHPKRKGETIEPDEYLVEKMIEAAEADERKKAAETARRRALQQMLVHFESIAPDAERIKGDGWSLGKRVTKNGWSPNPRGF